jgi:signal transduction histidine kinase/DNA-binding response OmpR family regulator/ligand-binding sensor domain-containing protein
MNKHLIPYNVTLFMLVLTISLETLSAQPKAYFEHYGAEDGLPQHTITDILQGSDDFMWFSTWNGLSKFDGYTFTTFQLPTGNVIESRSSRIDNIFEDKFNNIWTLTYDNQALRFNIETESFLGTNDIEELTDIFFSASQIIPKSSGKVWILSENDGCIAVIDSLFNSIVYRSEKNNLTNNFVYDVFEDTHDTWILTKGGLTCIKDDGSDPVFYFHPESETGLKSQAPFFSVMDFNNELWFASEEGNVWIYNKEREVFYQLQTELSSDVKSIREISSERILIVSKYDGFIIYNTHDGSMERYNRNTFPEIQFNEIITEYIDRSKNIWFETDLLGVSKFNPYTEEYKHYTPYIESKESSVFPPNFFIFEDIENRLWVHPRGGGFSTYDRESNQLIPFYNEPFSSNWIFSNMMHTAYSDRQGNLWMCTRSHGLEKVIFYDDSQFLSIVLNNTVNSTINNDVRPIFEDSEGMIWIATKDGKIHILNSQGDIKNELSIGGVVYSITEDSNNNIWLGTKGEGAYKLTRGKKSEEFIIQNYKHNPKDIYSLSNNNVYSIFEDRNRNIWIGTFGGGINLIMNNDLDEKFINHRNILSNYPIGKGEQVRIISEDKQGNISVGTTLGFIMFCSDFKSAVEIDFNVYTGSNSNNNSIGANDIMDICTTRSGHTYIGTFGGGVSKITDTDDKGLPIAFETFNKSHGLPSDIILSIQEDHNGNLWISSEGGLTKFNVQNETFENFSEIKRLMKRNNFSENSRCCLNNGRMLFGYSQGIILFDPGSVKNNRFNPNLALVGFRLFNREVQILPSGPLRKNLNLVEQLTLKHNQNFITLEFAALDYTDSKNILYAYKLEGFDKEWNYSGNQRIANYTNLSKGKYLFRVKSTNSDGVWADNERTLLIEILPPYWATWWAYLIYAMLFILAAFVAYKILYTFYRMRNKIILEKQESELKTRFFTNISHEIRTPLTMIVSPIENLLHSKEASESVKNQLKLVSKNTNRLLNMVNQILDFQKIEQSALTVNKVEIAPFVENIFSNYVKVAELKEIDYSFDNRVGNQTLWLDVDAIEKVIVNLLSNAFKFTSRGDSISLSLYNVNESIALQVKDSGLGISKDKQSRLFKRFESFNEDKSKPSTGIGLSIVKEMADKHKAEIEVESEENKGSTFRVIFKKGTRHFDSDVIFNDTVTTTTLSETDYDVYRLSDQQNTLPEKLNTLPSVLIVEDDEDLRLFIRSILENDYEVYEAADGKEGYEKAVELIPDFIVSDIMMPEADGMELLGNIRKNIRTSHILFLLLTAKTTLDSKLEGFQHGADEYITKPFSVSFFKARVQNLLNRRSELQHYYRNRVNISSGSKLIGAGEDQEISTNSKDLEFLHSVNSFIEEHLGNKDFVIEDIANEVGMSRSVFFKKLKGLTGLSPIEYVRDISLQHAAEIIEKGDFTVKEVAFMVGINDSKYFSRCFKKKYKMTPSEYKKEIKKSIVEL